MANNSGWEKNKKLVLAGLGALLLFVIIYSFFLSDSGSSGSSRRTSNTNSSASAPPRSTTVPVQTQRQVESATSKSSNRKEELEAELADLTPLELAVHVAATPATNPRGNIFAYYVEPPKPPPPPEPPPPIALQYVQPSSVIASTPKSFTLTVVGKGYPADAQILMNGRLRQTKRVNETTLSTEVAQGDYMSQGTINIEVRSQSDPSKMFSNQVALIVQAAPEPPFKYYGETGGNALLEVAGVFEHKGYRRGDTVQGVWRIDSITKDMIEVTHLQLGIKKAVAKQEKPR
jgi:hypothetical protein